MIGLGCVLVRDTNIYASPTWSPVLSVINLSVGGSTTPVDKSSRASPFKGYAPGQIDVNLTFSMNYADDPTNYTAFRTAWLARTATVDIAACNGPIATTGTIYMRIQTFVSKFEEKQDLEGEVMADVELKPTDVVAHPPAMTTV